MEIDLAPREWTSERAKQREPFFGAGAPGWGMWCLGFALSLSIAYWLRNI